MLTADFFSATECGSTTPRPPDPSASLASRPLGLPWIYDPSASPHNLSLIYDFRNTDGRQHMHHVARG
jgi:hypothetical protein